MFCHQRVTLRPGSTFGRTRSRTMPEQQLLRGKRFTLPSAGSFIMDPLNNLISPLITFWIRPKLDWGIIHKCYCEAERDLMPPHWTSDPRHFSSLTCDLQKLLSTFRKLEKLIIKWIRWEGRAGGAKVFTWMISPFTWNTAPCNFPPLKGGNFPQDEPITRSWCMIDVIQRLMKMKQMFLNRNIHLVSSFLSRRAGFHPARWRKKKKKAMFWEADENFII